MAQPALSPPVVAAALPVLGVDAMLRRLPAEARANVAWARAPIFEGLARLRSGLVTDELVASVAAQVALPLQVIGGAAWRALASNVDGYRAALMTDFASEEETLAAFVDDDASRDTLAWSIGQLRSFYGAVLANVGSRQRASGDASTLRDLLALPEMATLEAAVVVLMAATEEARLAGDPSRAMNLIDVSFLQLRQLREALGRRGFQLSAFPYATTGQRRESLAHAARRVRDALTSDDWGALSDARVSDLR